MKNKYLFLIIPLVLLLWSCEKETEDISQVKELPKITLKGKETVYLKAANLVSTWDEIGYQEEGATSSAGEIKIMNGIPENNIKPGVYYVKYIAVGDGVIETSKERKIVIYEDDGILSGIYSAKVSGIGETHEDIEVVISTVSVDDAGNKVYKCSDMYASFFLYWRNGMFPFVVAPSSDITVDAGGTITASCAEVPGTGGGASITGMRIDGDHLSWTTSSLTLGWLTVNVELTKQNL